jgi:Zn-dependent M28 family amino/carboxypeptidase
MARETLRRHVAVLAGAIGERNLFHPAKLRDAATFIEEAWRHQGYRVAPQAYEVDGVRCANLEVERRGKEWPAQIVVVGAHYDSMLGSPGADDNASGVAALLELSRRLVDVEPDRTIRLVAFVNEEPPFFQTEAMGSRRYARAARARGDDIRAMVALETIGYFSEAKGSQHYPPLMRLCYPARGNFVAFVSNVRSRHLLRRAVTLWRASSDVPVERLAAPSLVPGIDWSDHASFWREGYRAVMVTDTALYRYPYYHTAEDSPEKLDYDALTGVVDGLHATIVGLAH